MILLAFTNTRATKDAVGGAFTLDRRFWIDNVIGTQIRNIRIQASLLDIAQDIIQVKGV